MININYVNQLAEEYGVREDFALDMITKAVEQAWFFDFGTNYNIRMEVQQSKYGNNLRFYRTVTVVEDVKVSEKEISLKAAKSIDDNFAIGDEVKLDLDLSQISRGAVKIAENYISQNITRRKKQNEYEYFSDKVGTIINGTIKTKSSKGIILDFYGFEGLITDYKPSQFTEGEMPIGSKTKAYLYKIEENFEGFQVFLSRGNEEFLVELLKEEIPEIKNGLVTIKGVARNPGYKAIVLVKSEDSNINEIGVCIGSGGQRIKNIQKEIQNEKISIISWKDHLFQNIAEVIKHKSDVMIKAIILHEEDEEKERYIEVVVPQHQVSKVIGIRGRNIDLISRALGETIKITGEKETSTDSGAQLDEEEKLNIINEFQDKLHLHQDDIHTLINLGITTIEQIRDMEFSDFLQIPLEHSTHGSVYNTALENSPLKETKSQKVEEEQENEEWDDDEDYEDEYEEDE